MTTGILSIADKVRSAVAQVADVSLGQIENGYKLGGDELKIGRIVGLVEFLELKELLEEGCGVKIPDDEVQMRGENLRDTTVGQLVLYVQGLAGCVE